MVTDGFRARSLGPDVELVGVLPFTMVGVPTAGTAGGIATLPFAEAVVSNFPCCAGAAKGVLDPDVAGGGEKVFFVALA